MECAVCSISYPNLKQCSRCRSVKYCSTKCQKLDWPLHKSVCKILKPLSSTGDEYARDRPLAEEDVEVINVQSEPLTQRVGTRQYHIPYYDRSGVLRKEIFPQSLTTEPNIAITLKHNGRKLHLPVNTEWTGDLVFKLISGRLRTPIDEMKVIIKGKVQTQDTVIHSICNKTLVMVIGTCLEDSSGIDERDIACLMSQMNIDRNKAVLALKKHGSVLDAIIDIGNN